MLHLERMGVALMCGAIGSATTTIGSVFCKFITVPMPPFDPFTSLAGCFFSQYCQTTYERTEFGDQPVSNKMKAACTLVKIAGSGAFIYCLPAFEASTKLSAIALAVIGHYLTHDSSPRPPMILPRPPRVLPKAIESK